VNSDSRHLLDGAAWLSAGITAFSFWQGAALAITILAGAASFILAAIRIHDRLKYGPNR
jgi:hypothetical protein